MNRERIARVVESMKKAALPCILVSDPNSVYYLTGRMIHPGERMLALAVFDNGEAKLFCNRLFAQKPEEGLPLIEFDDTDDCVEILSRALPKGKIGIDKSWPSQFTIRLMEARDDIRPVLGSLPVDEARMKKGLDEREAMRVSSRMNDETLAKLIPTIKEGETELEISQRYAEIGKSLGAQSCSFPPLICFGKNGAEPHHGTDDTSLKEGDMIILDVGLNVNGAMSDMTRTAVLGRATDEQKEIYELVKAANKAARSMVAPGVPLKAIDAAARRVIAEAGYGDKFIHRTGHGIGLETHEPPDVSSASQYVAQPGMIFSIEPGIYLPGKFGVRIEDLVLVTEDGCETLNKLPRDLIEL